MCGGQETARHACRLGTEEVEGNYFFYLDTGERSMHCIDFML
jgi:hypothetical protein